MHSGTVRDKIQKQTGHLITDHFFGAGTGMLYLHKNIIVLYTAQLILYLGWGLDVLWHIEVVTFRRPSWLVRLSVFQSINRWNTWVGYLWSLLHRAQKVHILPETHTHTHAHNKRHTLISVHPGIFKLAHSGTEWCTNTSTPTFIFGKNSSRSAIAWLLPTLPTLLQDLHVHTRCPIPQQCPLCVYLSDQWGAHISQPFL